MVVDTQDENKDENIGPKSNINTYKSVGTLEDSVGLRCVSLRHPHAVWNALQAEAGLPPLIYLHLVLKRGVRILRDLRGELLEVNG